MSAEKLQLVSEKKLQSSDIESLQNRIKGFQSQELVIALSGPLGCGITTVADTLNREFSGQDYEIFHIKLSDLMKQYFIELRKNNPAIIDNLVLKEAIFEDLKGYERIDKLMRVGGFLRKNYEMDIVAQLAINEISKKRKDIAKPKYDEIYDKIPEPTISLAEYAAEGFKTVKTVYLIDQLKNHEEVKLLRIIYGDLFYLVGTLCNEDERKANLINNGIDAIKASELMERDKKEAEEHGQQLEKTLQLSDYFIRFSQGDRKNLKEQIQRIIKIIHGSEIITPTNDEYGMYLAYSASLKSACLSRQVGASIADNGGNIIATGCNDVPQFNGGLYSSNSSNDLRCYNKGGKCYNDEYKQTKIKDKLLEIIEDNFSDKTEAKKIADKMFSSTRLKDLIEFSRAIHAEMDAIITLARNGGGSTRGCTLYTTTYPCHNCARHIVAAGIHKVIYIEPYEKSLAMELHQDAIQTKDTEEQKVKFLHFEGVSPRKYQHFFIAHHEGRKKSGRLYTSPHAEHKAPEYLHGYRQLEAKAVQHFTELTGK